jgi:hypothetical protein
VPATRASSACACGLWAQATSDLLTCKPVCGLTQQLLHARLVPVQYLVLTIMNVRRSIAFVRDWLSACLDQHGRLLSDTRSTTEHERPEYSRHRHDQSVLSVMCVLSHH